MALLGFFVVSLLAAWLVTLYRGSVALSGPVRLEGTGLSVSIPSGNGWKSEDNWRYQDNSFVLSSVFAAAGKNTPAVVNCRYLLAACETAVDTQFTEKASEVNGLIVQKATIKRKTVSVDWAHITSPDIGLEIFLGVAALPDGRQLSIEVQQVADGPDKAGELFDRVIKSIAFKDDRLLAAGGETITAIKDKGVGSFTADADRQSFFLIKRQSSEMIGFTMSTVVSTASGILLADFLYLPGLYSQEQVSLFESDNRFDNFSWKSDTSSLVGASGCQSVLNDGVMTVIKSGRQVSENRYRLGPAAVPEFFLEFVCSLMLDSGRQKILIDVVGSNGTIIPAAVSVANKTDPANGETGTAYVFNIDFLNEEGFSEQFCLDDKRHIIKAVLRQEDTYVFERVEEKDILRRFPEQADHVSYQSRLLKQDSKRP